VGARTCQRLSADAITSWAALLSALDGVTPEKLNVAPLAARVANGIEEVILAMNATVEGQTTAHYLMDILAASKVKVTRLAHGVPVGGETRLSRRGHALRSLPRAAGNVALLAITLTRRPSCLSSVGFP